MKQYAAVKGEIAESCYVSPDFEDCVADVFSEFYTEHAKYAPTISSIKSYLWVLARFRAIAEYNFVFATIYGEHSETATRRRKNFGPKKNGEAHRLVRRKFWNLVTSNKNIVKIYQNPLQFHCMCDIIILQIGVYTAWHFIIGGGTMIILNGKLSNFMRNHILYRSQLWGGQSKRIKISA